MNYKKIKQVTGRLGGRLERQWIESHQQNKESLVVEINDWVDRLAEGQHNSKGS